MKKAATTEGALSITEIELTQVQFYVLGDTPLVPHAVSHKSKGALLWPSGKKNEAEKASSMKHEPFDEFREAAYQFVDDDHPTRLYMPGAAFHSAMASVAIDMVGAKKAQVGRLTTVLEEMVCVWGVPQIYSTIVRSSDMKRTPDVRTLPILPRWAATFTVSFVGSLIKPASVANLIGSAGVIIGIGDGRPEKGKLSFGKFKVVNSDDAALQAVMKSGGRKAQDEALRDPQFYNLETEKLLTWFEGERSRRIATPTKETKRKPAVSNVVAAKAGKRRRRNGGATIET